MYSLSIVTNLFCIIVMPTMNHYEYIVVLLEIYPKWIPQINIATYMK